MKTARLGVQLLLYIVIILGVYLSFVDFSSLKLNTADASTYLNIAENIASHKGFVVSFDLYQCFKGLYHPLWPFMHPIYPLLCSLVFLAHGGIEQVIKVNIFILGVNAALIFYFIQSLIPSRLNVFYLVYLVFSFNFIYSAFFPWTEQLHLLFFLISFILFLKSYAQPRLLFTVGILNGVLFLIRVSHVYSILAYLFVLCIAEGKVQERLKRILIFIIGFSVVLVPYQLFNWLTFHALYPEYIKPAADYTYACHSRLSTYRPGHVGIYNPVGIRFTLSSIPCFCAHVVGLCRNYFLFFIPIVFYFSSSYVAVLTKFVKDTTANHFVLNCVAQSLFIILGYSYSFCWDPDLETGRYSLIPFVLISLAGWYCFYVSVFLHSNKVRKLVATAILVSLVFLAVLNYWKIRQKWFNEPKERVPYFSMLYQSYRWIDQNLPKEVLVASDDNQEGYFLHRPFISMPTQNSFSCVNLRRYDSIFLPDYYLISTSIPDSCFNSIQHTKIYSNNLFRLFEITRKKK